MTERALDRYRGMLTHSVPFDGLASGDLDAVLSRCRLLEVDAQRELLTEGTAGPGLYVILEGAVEVFLPERSAGPIRRATAVQLNILGPGRCLGEYGLIDDQPSSASARAAAGARLCFLARDDFRDLADRHERIGKTFYLNLLRFLIARLREKDQELDLVLLVEPRSPSARR